MSSTTTTSAAATADAFQGRVIGGTGRYAGFHGRFSFALHPAPGGATRLLTIIGRGRICRQRCAAIRLTLRGLLTVRRGIPADAGSRFTLRARGATSIGHLNATGSGHGTGFIAHGREQLRVTITGEGGRFTVAAESRPVRGFTSP